MFSRSCFYRSLFFFHAIIAVCEFVLTLSLLILILITHQELFFKTSNPDDQDWELIGFQNRMIILGLFVIGAIRTVILFIVIFLVIAVTSYFFCLLCTKCYRKALWQLFTSKAAHRFFSFNCNCPCYRARPKLRFQLQFLFVILVSCIRIGTIIFCLTLRHHITTKSLAVIVAISFVFLILSSLLDYYHYRIWWHYKPDFQNLPIDFEMPMGSLSPKHRRFIPYHLVGDNRTTKFGDKPCSAGTKCQNRSLEHIFIFHFKSFNPQPRYFDIEQTTSKNRYIGFHQTDPASAIMIAHSDFLVSTKYESTMIGHGIYFARSREGTERKANRRGAFICAEIDMGTVLELKPNQRNLYRGKSDWWETHDTAYFCHGDENLDEFCVKSPDQVLNWIIMIERNFDTRVQIYGLNQEFDDTSCGCI